MFKNYIYIPIFYALLIGFVAMSCQSDKTSYKVHGRLENVNDTVFLAARETGDSLFVDTIKINSKGEFSFKGVVDTLTVISLYFNETVKSPYILVDKGWDIEVKGDLNFSDLISVKGGVINDELTNFKIDNDGLIKSRSKIMNHIEDVAANTDSIVGKEYSIELNNVNFELLNKATAYVQANPSKISSVIIIDNFFKDEIFIERLSESLDMLKGVAYDFPLAQELRDYKDRVKRSTIGATAPNFILKDLNGESVSLKDFSGKYILLSFVSTTCGVCAEIAPDVVNTYNKLKSEKKNIEFISIVKDVEDKPLLKKDRIDMKWISLPEYGGWSSKIFEEYNIKELPYSILISPTGVILERDVSIYTLPTKLDTYLHPNK